MTIFAGVIARKQSAIPNATRDALVAAVSRTRADRPLTFEGDGYCCVKVDIGAFGVPGAIRDDSGAFSLLVGEPLLTGPQASDTRADDLRKIHEHCGRGDLSILASATGVYAVGHYNESTRTLFLIADKLAIRPVYYFADEEYVVFATALRILEALSSLPKILNLQALAEISAFGYPLGARTPFCGIHALRAGEAVEVSARGISSHFYWRWEAGVVKTESDRVLPQTAYRAFVNGVARRIRSDRHTAAYLSGGLDSRSVVAALVSQGVSVHTFNFARPGTQDRAFGAQIATRLGTIHHEVPKPKGQPTPDFSRLMADVWSATLASIRGLTDLPVSMGIPEHPSLVWSGEGGSVVLGHVHMHREVLDNLRTGQVTHAIDKFFMLEDIRIPAKIFHRALSESFKSLLHDGVSNELQLGPENADPARRFYLFLLQNDQRRKLAHHFENIDENRLELQLPFFDSDFVSTVIQVPVDWCIEHRFYSDWLLQFDPAVSSVPWQSYPGHVPCPLAVPPDLSYQWNARQQAKERRAKKKRLLRRVAEIVFGKHFPHPVLSRPHVAAAAALHATAIRDYDYALEAAVLLEKYWRASSSVDRAS